MCDPQGIYYYTMHAVKGTDLDAAAAKRDQQSQKVRLPRLICLMLILRSICANVVVVVVVVVVCPGAFLTLNRRAAEQYIAWQGK